MKSYNGYRSYPSYLTSIYILNDYNAYMQTVGIIKNAESKTSALAALRRLFEGAHTPYDNNLIRRAHLVEFLDAEWEEHQR